MDQGGAALEVELLGRAGCHLCETALALLRAAGRRRPLRIRLVDIDDDPELLRRYDLRVPVVRIAGEAVCEGVITPLELADALGGAVD